MTYHHLKSTVCVLLLYFTMEIYSKQLIIHISALLGTIHIIESCHTFQNTLVTAKERDGDIFQQRINGCLERKSFDGQSVREVSIVNEDIPVFAMDAVRHLIYLQKLTINNTRIGELRPRAFRNVPRLEEVHMTNCSLSEIPAQVFNNATSLIELDFYNNKIALIEDGAFDDLASLRKFNVSHNLIFFWSKDWFGNNPSLEVIDLSHNQIINLPVSAFEGLRKLREVHLDYNDIATIDENAFKDVRFLQYLGMRHNKLATINSQAFPNHIRINELHIEANRLTFLPEQMLNNMKIEEIAIHGNPLNCHCLSNLMEWINENHCKVLCKDSCNRMDLPICVTPNMPPNNGCNVISDVNDVERYFVVYGRIQPPVDTDCVRFE